MGSRPVQPTAEYVLERLQEGNARLYGASFRIRTRTWHVATNSQADSFLSLRFWVCGFAYATGTYL